jgi:transposase
MPRSTAVDSPQEEQAEMLVALRRARYGYLLALLKAAPRALRWCRTGWSCATLALTLKAKRGIKGSAERMRRWVEEVGWVWKRAKLVAKDDDPQRVERLARIRFVYEELRLCEAILPVSTKSGDESRCRRTDQLSPRFSYVSDR